MTGPSAHHELGASGAYRWLNCPGSVAAQRGLPESSSVYAEEGTSAHELAEVTLQFWQSGKGLRATQEWRAAAEAAGYDCKEMIREVEKYVEYVKDLCGGDKDQLRIEVRVSFGDLIPGGFGTADAVVVVRGLEGEVEHVHVGDLKYGKGKRVDAEKNSQLLLYGFGVVRELIETNVIDEDFDNFDEIPVTLHICQPRLDHFDTYTTDVQAVLDWARDEVAPVVNNITVHEDDTRVAGSHCDFCKALPTCRAKAEAVASALADDWDDFEENGPNLTKPVELTAEEIGRLLTHKKDIEKYFNAVKDHAYSTIERGGDIPGWKLVQGNKAKSWNVDEDELLEAFKGQRALKQDEYAPRKLLTPAQAVKVLPEKSKIRDLIDEKHGAPTLVEASNKKPALVFGKIEDEFDDDEDDDL